MFLGHKLCLVFGISGPLGLSSAEAVCSHLFLISVKNSLFITGKIKTCFTTARVSVLSQFYCVSLRFFLIFMEVSSRK